MVLGEDKARMSNGALGCTFETAEYVTQIDGVTYRLWDTAGLNEGKFGTVTGADAVARIFHLIQKLKDGVHLLVFCIRVPRIHDTAARNYQIFSDGLCASKVPTVIIMTGLENEEPMDEWWEENKTQFTRMGMSFNGHACITATKGKFKTSLGAHTFEKEYKESVPRVKKLISNHCLEEGWKMVSVYESVFFN